MKKTIFRYSMFGALAAVAWVCGVGVSNSYAGPDSSYPFGSLRTQEAMPSGSALTTVNHGFITDIKGDKNAKKITIMASRGSCTLIVDPNIKNHGYSRLFDALWKAKDSARITCVQVISGPPPGKPYADQENNFVTSDHFKIENKSESRLYLLKDK